MIGAVTVDELVHVMTENGKPIGRAALRYHCRDPRGALFGIAYRSGPTWLIPVAAADAFAAQYTRGKHTRPRGRKTGPEAPPASGPALSESHTPQRRARER